MSTGAECVVALFGGAVLGAGASIAAMNKHFKNKAQDEVEEIRTIYAQKARDNGDFEKEEKINKVGTPPEKEADKKKAEDIAEEKGYTKYSRATDDTPVGLNKKRSKDWIEPYIIDPMDFDEHADDGLGWDTRTLYYFSDGVLADEEMNKIEDATSMIGSRENLNHFGEYGDDSLYIRNDNRKLDYEILLDARTWKEVNAKRPKPRMMED